MNGNLIEALESRRLLTGGLDGSFGTGGTVLPTATITTSNADAVVVRPDKRILQITGSDLRQLNADGSLDTTFGNSGSVPLGALISFPVQRLTLAPDGKILLLGDGGVIRLNADGSTDNSFGTSGRASLNLSPFDVTAQPDGKIVAVGSKSAHLALVRLLPNGAVDTTFNKVGRFILDLPGSDEKLLTVAIQSDGKIIAGGYSVDGRNHDQMTILRLLPNGKLDLSFDKTGSRVLGGKGFDITDIHSMSDGRIVAAGNSPGSTYGGTQFGYFVGSAGLVVRLKGDGTSDSSFDGDGFALVSPPYRTDSVFGDITVAGIARIGVRSDGKVVFAATGSPGGLVAGRLTSSGKPDTTFAEGKAAVAFSIYGGGQSLGGAIVGSDGSVVFSATATNFSLAALARVNPAGQLDPKFGVKGKMVQDLTGELGEFNDVVMQPDGKIVAAGYTDSPVHGSVDFYIARYNRDGSLDPTFGSGGKTLIDFLGFADRATSIALQSNGKIIVSGKVSSFTSDYYPEEAFNIIGVARLDTSGKLDAGFGTSGKTMLRSVDFYSGNNPTMLIDSKDRIYVSGYRYPGAFVQRLTASGRKDSTFVASDLPLTAAPAAMAFVSGGGIMLMLGASDNPYGEAGKFVRLKSTGALDTTFGGDGVVTTPFLGRSTALKITSGDKMLVASNVPANPNQTELTTAAVRQFNADGTPDLSFGVGGIAQFPQVPGTDLNQTMDLAVDDKGRITIAAFVRTPLEKGASTSSFATGRFNADGSIDTSYHKGKLSVAVFPPLTRFDDHTPMALDLGTDGSAILAGNGVDFTNPDAFRGTLHPALALYTGDSI